VKFRTESGSRTLVTITVLAVRVHISTLVSLLSALGTVKKQTNKTEIVKKIRAYENHVISINTPGTPVNVIGNITITTILTTNREPRRFKTRDVSHSRSTRAVIIRRAVLEKPNENYSAVRSEFNFEIIFASFLLWRLWRISNFRHFVNVSERIETHPISAIKF